MTTQDQRAQSGPTDAIDVRQRGAPTDKTKKTRQRRSGRERRADKGFGHAYVGDLPFADTGQPPGATQYHGFTSGHADEVGATGGLSPG